MDDFESTLANQTLKSAPDDWRAEILSNARDAERSGAESTSQAKQAGSSLLLLIRGWLWPHPGAWAGVAAIWLLLIAMQHQMNVEIQEELTLAGIEPPVTDVMVAMERHQFVIKQLLAMNHFELPPMDRQKRIPQSPTNLPPLMLFTAGISWEYGCRVEVGDVLLDVLLRPGSGQAGPQQAPQNSLADPIPEFGGNRMVFRALCAPGGSALRSRSRRPECFETVSAGLPYLIPLPYVEIAIST